MLFSAVLLILYAVPHIADPAPGTLPSIPLASTVMAATIFVYSLFARFRMPPERLHQSAIGLYTLTLLSLALLIANDGLTSVFMGFIAVVAFCAGFFRAPGILLTLLVVNGIIAYDYYTNGLTVALTLPALLTFNLPALFGWVLFYRIPDADGEATKEDRSYHELATQLSRVSGKSDVVINAIGDGVVMIDNSGVVELINPAAQNMIGWGRQDAIGLDYKSVLKLVNDKNEPPDPTVDPIAKVLVTNHQESTEAFSIITNSGKKLLIALTVSPVGQAGSGVIIVFRDVTAQRAEERQQAEFISTASHEMRTPVASIEGYLGLVLNPATATIDEKARDFVSKAHAAAQHLGRLFQDLLDVSKAEDGRLKSNPSMVDVVPFVKEIFDGLAVKAQEKGLRYVFKPALENDTTPGQRGKLIARNLSPVYYANVDNDHLREVTGNLIENAIKYTPSGEVAVDVSGEDDKITISVADTGLGIPKEDQLHLFQKFYRVDNSETREIGGTGLGLYLCRRLAEAMDGRIWLESEYKKGSTFHLEIPRVSHIDATKIIETGGIVQQPAHPALPEPTPVLQPQPQPAPIPPNAQPYPPIPSAHSSGISGARVNTPLTAIEANPARYLQSRQLDITPPPRKPQIKP